MLVADEPIRKGQLCPLAVQLRGSQRRIAIESYREIIRYLANDDPTSRQMMETILANEEEHAKDLRTLPETNHPGREGTSLARAPVAMAYTRSLF
jgi:bacterioferritin (cytochrome b1)